MDRLVQRNVLAMSGRAVEAAGDVSTLLLDKTGTITVGNRHATELLTVHDVTERELAEAALLASLADETPEGRSIVDLCVTTTASPRRVRPTPSSCRSPPRPACRASTCSMGREIRKGAADAVRRYVADQGGSVPPELTEFVESISREGGTPLVVADGARILGVIRLKDIVKPGLRERFDELRRLGIRTVMITGDNPLTAAAIAEEAGLDGFLAEATPEQKLALIKQEQRGGNLVAMTGDGTNDAPALAQADVGVAMNTGTQAAREAGNMVDLDSDPTKLIEIVEIGKQLLITRGSLTTFSIANDVAKYFAIIPAMFSGVLPALDRLNVMGLETPRSAILSAVIFNAIIIVLLVPLALRGVKFVALHRHRDPATQPPRLRRRRPDRPVRRHQAHRHGHLGPGSEVMRRQLVPAVVAIVLFTVMTLVYSVGTTLVDQVLFPHKADGSLVKDASGQVVGSSLIGQSFATTEYFHPRPAADGYAAGPDYSYGSNYGPTNPAFLYGEDDPETPDVDESKTNGVDDLVRAYRAENGLSAAGPGAGRRGDGVGQRARPATSRSPTPSSRRRRVATAPGPRRSPRSSTSSTRTPTGGPSASSASRPSTSSSSTSRSIGSTGSPVEATALTERAVA